VRYLVFHASGAFKEHTHYDNEYVGNMDSFPIVECVYPSYVFKYVSWNVIKMTFRPG